MHLLHVFQEIQRRNNVWHHLTMPNGIAFHFYLSFIQMRLAVPFSCEVILVATPCDAGHELGLITPFLPRPDTFLNRIITDYIERIASHPIDHDNVCPIVHQLVPRMGRLEGSMIIYPVLQVDSFNDTFQRTTIGCRLYFMERTIPIASETLGDWVIIICHDRFSIFQDKFSISLLLVHLIKISQMPDENAFKLDSVGTGFRFFLQLSQDSIFSGHSFHGSICDMLCHGKIQRVFRQFITFGKSSQSHTLIIGIILTGIRSPVLVQSILHLPIGAVYHATVQHPVGTLQKTASVFLLLSQLVKPGTKQGIQIIRYGIFVFQGISSPVETTTQIGIPTRGHGGIDGFCHI